MTFAPPVIPSVGHVGERSCMRVPDRSALADVARPRAAAVNRCHRAFYERLTASVSACATAAAPSPTAATTVNSP